MHTAAGLNETLGHIGVAPTQRTDPVRRHNFSKAGTRHASLEVRILPKPESVMWAQCASVRHFLAGASAACGSRKQHVAEMSS